MAGRILGSSNHARWIGEYRMRAYGINTDERNVIPNTGTMQSASS
jgi:hypothetical protein